MALKISHNEALVLREIKNLTKKQGYGSIVIVIRKGLIKAVQVTETISTLDSKGEHDLTRD